MINIIQWILNHWELATAAALIFIRFIESGLLTKKWNIIALLKEFFTLR